MKKILALSIAILFSGVLFAQHSAGPVQLPDNYVPNAKIGSNNYGDAMMAGTMAYFTENQFNEFSSVVLPAGAPITVINGPLPGSFGDGDFGPGGIFYAVTWFDNYLYTIDITTGIAVQHVMLSGNNGNDFR